MFYQLYELNHAFLSPARAVNDAIRLYYKNPLNPLAHTEMGRQIAAAGDVFERLTRRYGKPEFGLSETEVDGRKVAVREEIVWERPFCRLVHFRRALPADMPRQGNLVIVAPMSGHYATLLRGTVQAMLPHHEVYITDWADARMVPIAMGRFDLDDYIDYVVDIVRHFGGDVHLMAVCQPAVPVFAATALMEADGSVHPKSLTLMGGPIDTRENPTEVNTYAAKHDLDWFRRNAIQAVPFPHPGMMRQVYPGFLQLTGFMTMNLDRHMSAHYDYFDHLVKGDGEPAEKHREFYDEYLSVMDLTAEFYLQTVDTVFLRHALPRGTMRHRNRLVDPGAIRATAIFTVEGEKDDISGIGQTQAAHKLTPNLPDERHAHYEQGGVGHYGVFNGSRFRREIAPRITAWIGRWNGEARPAATVPTPVPFAAAAHSATAAVVELAAAAMSVPLKAASAVVGAAAAAAAAPVAVARTEAERAGGAEEPPAPTAAVGDENPAEIAAEETVAALGGDPAGEIATVPEEADASAERVGDDTPSGGDGDDAPADDPTEPLAEDEKPGEAGDAQGDEVEAPGGSGAAAVVADVVAAPMVAAAAASAASLTATAAVEAAQSGAPLAAAEAGVLADAAIGGELPTTPSRPLFRRKGARRS